jgi:hypothetical protein
MLDITKQHELLKHLEDYGNKCYQKGLEDGLRVAETICGWLNIQPPRKYAQKIRKWGKKAIERARNGGTSTT